ncbi:MAG: metallophosphoesterase [Sphingobacteriales bacterium]|nr:MAG: metallophosphoesterase [Sphingobacteriales bacterium]
MSDFIVLHFTDLHIKKENITKYNLLFKKIVSYINDIKDESNSFIIIFGGDIIDRNNNCEVSIKCFSEFVNNIICGINNDVNKNIYIVFAGGNHDLCTDICYTCTRCDEVKSFLNSIERNVNQFIEKNLCEIEDDCTCSKIINSRDKHKLFDDVHRKKIKDKVIEEIFEHKTCKIFDKEKYNGRKTNGIEMLKEITYYNIKSATQDISNNIFKIKHNILKYYNYSETYKNYISLIDKLKENYKDKNNINIVSFVDDNFVNGFKKIEIKNRLNIGILNLNTSWLSTNGDHLNYKNLYIINENRIKNCGFNRKDSKNDFNILILHHPLEYISDNCTQTVEYLKNIRLKKQRKPKNI